MEDQFEEALKVGLAFLVPRDRLVAEVQKRLARFDPSTVDRVVESLQKRGILNDERTIRNRLEANAGRRRMGAAKLRDDLQRKGADEAVLNAIVMSDPPEAMDALLAGKYRREASERARAGRFLLSRGFEEEATEAALCRYFGDRFED